MDYVALKNEILTDPLSLGYTGQSDQATANLMNASRAGQTVTLSTCTPAGLWEAITPSDWAAATAAQQGDIKTLLTLPAVTFAGAHTAAVLSAAFGPATQTTSNINGLKTRQGSRAEVLFGAGMAVNNAQVAYAMGRGSQP